MEDAVYNRRSNNTLGYRAAATINGEYAVIHSDGEIYTLRLNHLDAEIQHLPSDGLHRWRSPILRLAPALSNLLAIAEGPEVYIFDLDSQHLKHVIPGNGRTVTSLSLYAGGARVAATGHIDGSICLWNVDNLNRPSERFQLTGLACDALEFSTVDANCLASLHGGKIYIQCSTSDRWQSLCVLSGVGHSAFSWHPSRPGRLAASNTDGRLYMFDLSDTIDGLNSTSATDRRHDESDGGVFGPVDDIITDLQPISETDVGAPLKSLSWAGDAAIIAIIENGEASMLYEVQDHGRVLTELWRSRFEYAVEAIRVLQEDERTFLMGIGAEGTNSRDIPEDVAKRAQLNEGRFAHFTASSTGDLYPAKQTTPLINPLSISSQKAETSAFAKTSKQFQYMRRMSRFKTNLKSAFATEASATKPQAISGSPQSPTLQSEGDSAIFEADDDFGSPMPFLSPSIPSNKALPYHIPLLNDSAITPPKLRDRSQNVSEISKQITSTNGPDTDDSDDEAFVDDMHGSAAFLPGGINVPLPKACGALFAPNGQLLTFFPPKAKPAIAQQEPTNDRPAHKLGESDRTARLFPTFGNLEVISASTSEDSESENFDVLGDENKRLDSTPRFVIQPASFPSQQSWKARDAAGHPTVYSEQPQHRIIVNVHEIADVQPMPAEQRTIARTYRLLCKHGESGAELCEHNAIVADTVGSSEIAAIWRLIAMLLSDRVPLSVLSPGLAHTHVLAVAREAMSLGRSDSGVDLQKHDTGCAVSEKLHWANHPFAASWLVRRILAWAEDRADIQSLACFSAILSEAGYSSSKPSSTEQSMLTRLATYSSEYIKEAGKHTSRTRSKQAIPILRTHAATITSIHESPTKVLSSGELSTSLASQTSLNYSDSSVTPPFPSPLLSRQSTRLSASGASSPEFQRGSFSTAAKYYAASFSEKFGYGTSPPVKKADTSPTTSNELSTSLPGGSWPGKSVSFASTTTESSAQRSMSTSASRSNVVEDVGYDSDKTVEDNSLPYTSRTSRNNVAVNLSKHNAFADENCGITRLKLMPDDLSTKIAIWNSYYAEQLRCWELLAQASELEKVFGLTTGVQLGMDSAITAHEGLLPKGGSRRGNVVCEICLVGSRGIMQVCPACLHSSHLTCLEDFCAEIAEAEFTCPSGCGCTCAELPFLVQEIARQSPQRPAFKKKASFTDPRRWRARNEGDSW